MTEVGTELERPAVGLLFQAEGSDMRSDCRSVAMRHDEWINLHALLREIRAYMEHCGDTSSEAFAAYEYQHARPRHLHRRKRDHKRATRLLLWGILRSIETKTDIAVARH